MIERRTFSFRPNVGKIEHIRKGDVISVKEKEVSVKDFLGALLDNEGCNAADIGNIAHAFCAFEGVTAGVILESRHLDRELKVWALLKLRLIPVLTAAELMHKCVDTDYDPYKAALTALAPGFRRGADAEKYTAKFIAVLDHIRKCAKDRNND